MSVPIPVIMFHTVRPREIPWFWNFLSCPPELFEGYLRYLKRNGYTTVLLPELVEHLQGRRELPEKSIALTFDDGYLDNWTIAAPILAKYGYCGTVFVNPEFVDPRDILRKQVSLGEWSSVVREQVDGFMSWNELREVQKSGVLDVQAHGMTHTWYPASDEIVDFHHPGDRYPWLAWNARPERKYMWLTEDQSEFVEYGTPVYAHEKSFITRRYFEPADVAEKCTAFVRANGGREFFSKPDWRELLWKEASSVESTGRYESEEEYRTRVTWELKTSREEISVRLNKPVDIVCWPGGGYNDITCEEAARLGFTGWTVRMKENTFGNKSLDIGRISIPMLEVGPISMLVNRLVFTYQVEGYRGSSPWRQAKWLLRRLRRLMRGHR